jgi:hypothetical protein
MKSGMKLPARIRPMALAIAATALVIGSGEVARASISGSGGVLRGCYAKSTRGLRLADPSHGQNCASMKGTVNSNQAGPAAEPQLPDPAQLGMLDWWGGSYNSSNYDFHDSRDIAFDGTHLWVTNFARNSVTELNASDGSLVRVLSGARYRFSRPSGIAFDGTHLWVTNAAGNSVTEFSASDGSLAQVLSGGVYGLDVPAGIAFDGTDIWLTNMNGNSVSEIPA